MKTSGTRQALEASMKKSMILGGLISTVIAFSAIASADCKQANLKASDGDQISIHYSSYSHNDGDTATVLPSIHVALSGGKCSAKEVIVQMISSQYGSSHSTPYTLKKLGVGQCEFSARANSTTIENHGGILSQQIAVQVIYTGGRSEWLVDPMNNGHNFNYAFDSRESSPQTEICE
jgi:hypothetical protein